MHYEVNMYYKDDKHLKVDVLGEEISRFFADLTAHQVYIHPMTKIGFWTNINDIRYIKVHQKEDDGEVIKSPDPVSGDVQERDGDNPEGEAAPQ